MDLVAAAARVSVDREHMVVGCSGDLWRVFGGSLCSVGDNYEDWVKAKHQTGWKFLSGCFEPQYSYLSPVYELSNAQFLTAVQISNAGEVYLVRQHACSWRSGAEIYYIPTELRIDFAEQGSADEFTDVVIQFLNMFDSERFGEVFGGLIKRILQCDFLANSDGIVFVTRGIDGKFGPGSGETLQMPQWADRLGQLHTASTEQRYVIMESNMQDCSICSVEKEQIYPNGPVVYLGRRFPLSAVALSSAVAERYPSITEKEAEVVAHIALGFAPKVVAGLLDKSNITVGLQIRSAMAKIGVSTRSELQLKVFVECVYSKVI